MEDSRIYESDVSNSATPSNFKQRTNQRTNKKRNGDLYDSQPSSSKNAMDSVNKGSRKPSNYGVENAEDLESYDSEDLINNEGDGADAMDLGADGILNRDSMVNLGENNKRELAQLSKEVVEPALEMGSVGKIGTKILND